MKDSSLFQLSIDGNTGASLRSAASWGKVLGILGIIFGILFIIIGVLVKTATSSTFSEYNDYNYRGSASTLGSVGMVMYLLMGIFTILGSVFALNFGNKAATALRSNDAVTLTSSLNNLRNYFAFWSILMIIGLLLTIIGIAGGAMI